MILWKWCWPKRVSCKAALIDFPTGDCVGVPCCKQTARPLRPLQVASQRRATDREGTLHLIAPPRKTQESGRLVRGHLAHSKKLDVEGTERDVSVLLWLWQKERDEEGMTILLSQQLNVGLRLSRQGEAATQHPRRELTAGTVLLLR